MQLAIGFKTLLLIKLYLEVRYLKVDTKDKLKNIISINDLTYSDINRILSLALDIEAHPDKYKDILKGKVLANLFFEPSTRTKLSFETAIKKLGGNTIGFDDISTTSVSKGETFSDTIKIISGYADFIVIRSKIEGSPRYASEIVSVPIINAGDGTNQHPTQTLLDLYTIKKEKGKIENLNIGFLGDLKYGRTVHSLIYALKNYKPKRIKFIAPKELQIPKEYTDFLNTNKIKYSQLTDLKNNLSDLDVLYVTRTQLERIAEPIDIEHLKKKYTINLEVLKEGKKDLIILHPLPRTFEIAKEIDSTSYAKYFSQAKNGLYVRQAILCILGGVV